MTKNTWIIFPYESLKQPGRKLQVLRTFEEMAGGRHVGYGTQALVGPEGRKFDSHTEAVGEAWRVNVLIDAGSKARLMELGATKFAQRKPPEVA